MSRFRILGAAVMLSMMTTTPLFAQAAIQEPGAFAFYHPNADVLNGGVPTPAARMASVPFSNSNALAAVENGAGGMSCAHRCRRRRTGAIGESLQRNGGRTRRFQASVGSVLPSGADASYCAQRWAYYDRASGKYMGDDGEWRPCP